MQTCCKATANPQEAKRRIEAFERAFNLLTQLLGVLQQNGSPVSQGIAQESLLEEKYALEQTALQWWTRVNWKQKMSCSLHFRTCSLLVERRYWRDNQESIVN